MLVMASRPSMRPIASISSAPTRTGITVEINGLRLLYLFLSLYAHISMYTCDLLHKYKIHQCILTCMHTHACGQTVSFPSPAPPTRELAASNGVASMPPFSTLLCCFAPTAFPPPTQVTCCLANLCLNEELSYKSARDAAI